MQHQWNRSHKKSLLFESAWICSSLSLQHLCWSISKGTTIYYHRAALCKQGLPPILNMVKSRVNLHLECASLLFYLSMEDINQCFLWKQCSGIWVKIVMNLKRGKWIVLKIDSYSAKSTPLSLRHNSPGYLQQSRAWSLVRTVPLALIRIWAHPRPCRTAAFLCRAIKLPDSSCAAPFRFS